MSGYEDLPSMRKALGYHGKDWEGRMAEGMKGRKEEEKRESILPGNQGMILKVLPVSAERRFKAAQTNLGVGRCRQKLCKLEQRC